MAVTHKLIMDTAAFELEIDVDLHNGYQLSDVSVQVTNKQALCIMEMIHRFGHIFATCGDIQKIQLEKLP